MRPQFGDFGEVGHKRKISWSYQKFCGFRHMEAEIPSKIEWDLTNGPRSVSCNRAIRYSGLGVR